jgi:hypothetical protein
MTDDANPEPGWYWIRSADSDNEFPLRLQEEGYWCLPGRLDRWFPPSWRIVARIDDLLRDAARLNWLIEHQRIGLRGESPKEIRQAIDAEIAREKPNG